MRSIILFIAMLLPSLCFAGQGMGPGPGTSRVNFHIYDFEDGTFQGWKGTDGVSNPQGSISNAVSTTIGLYSLSSLSVSGAATITVQHSLVCAPGPVTVQVRGPGSSNAGVRLLIDDVQQSSLESSSGSWQTLTGNIGSSGTHNIKIVFYSTNGSGQWAYIDNVQIPVPLAPYSDAFTGTDGTALSAHDPNWVSVDAGHLVSGLALYGDTARSAAGAWGGAIYNASSSDTSQISVQPVSASVLKGPCVRAGGSNGTGYCIDLGSKVGSNYTRLNLRKNGVVLTYATVAAPVSSSYTLRVEASGTAPAIIDCYMDGSLAISRTDSSSPLTGGHPGFVVESNGSIEDTAVDNWLDYAN